MADAPHLKAVLASGAGIYRPFFYALLAEACGRVEQVGAGLPRLAEALATVGENGQRYIEAEFQRLEGELLLRQIAPDVSQAEACFHQALSIARHQQAKSWELRAATSLARLWQSQGKRQEAYELLEPVYGWWLVHGGV